MSTLTIKKNIYSDVFLIHKRVFFMSRRLARHTHSLYYKQFKKAFEADLLNTSIAVFFLIVYVYISMLWRYGNRAISLYSKPVIWNVFSLLAAFVQLNWKQSGLNAACCECCLLLAQCCELCLNMPLLMIHSCACNPILYDHPSLIKAMTVLGLTFVLCRSLLSNSGYPPAHAKNWSVWKLHCIHDCERLNNLWTVAFITRYGSAKWPKCFIVDGRIYIYIPTSVATSWASFVIDIPSF